jgi:large subunit ribosomal protein L30
MISITQNKSSIGCSAKIKSTLVGLGLRRIGHQVVLAESASVLGMVAKVKHLVKIKGEQDVKTI